MVGNGGGGGVRLEGGTGEESGVGSVAGGNAGSCDTEGAEGNEEVAGMEKGRWRLMIQKEQRGMKQ